MLRNELRSATREHHDRLERKLDIPRSIRTRADYARLLGRMYGVYIPLEEQMLTLAPALSEHGIHVRSRLKAPKLELDLAALGWTQDAVAQLPRCTELPRIQTDVQVLGCLYVLEGSTLGGQIIAKRVRTTLGFSDDAALGFFRAYGDQTAQMWKALVERMNAYPASEAQIEQAKQAACETFDAIERWLPKTTAPAPLDRSAS